MEILTTDLPDLLELRAVVRADERGSLTKTFEASVYRDAGLPVSFAEELHTTSRAGVLRGMHFQLPPAAQGKVVFCAAGAIHDVVVDIRRGSPTYGRSQAFELSSAEGNGLWVPEGFAHGFCVAGDWAVVSYRLTASYAPGLDAGIRWDSIGVTWPLEHPVVSPKDAALPALDAFDTPFVYRES